MERFFDPAKIKGFRPTLLVDGVNPNRLFRHPVKGQPDLHFTEAIHTSHAGNLFD